METKELSYEDRRQKEIETRRKREALADATKADMKARFIQIVSGMGYVIKNPESWMLIATSNDDPILSIGMQDNIVIRAMSNKPMHSRESRFVFKLFIDHTTTGNHQVTVYTEDGMSKVPTSFQITCSITKTNEDLRAEIQKRLIEPNLQYIPVIKQAVAKYSAYINRQQDYRKQFEDVRKKYADYPWYREDHIDGDGEVVLEHLRVDLPTFELLCKVMSEKKAKRLKGGQT